MSIKECPGFFFFCLDIEFFQKLKRPDFYTIVFYIFINKLRSKQNEKNPEYSFVDIAK